MLISPIKPCSRSEALETSIGYRRSRPNPRATSKSTRTKGDAYCGPDFAAILRSSLGIDAEAAPVTLCTNVAGIGADVGAGVIEGTSASTGAGICTGAGAGRSSGAGAGRSSGAGAGKSLGASAGAGAGFTARQTHYLPGYALGDRHLGCRTPYCENLQQHGKLEEIIYAKWR